MLEHCLFCTNKTVESQNTLLKANGVCSIQYKFAYLKNIVEKLWKNVYSLQNTDEYRLYIVEYTTNC